MVFVYKEIKARKKILIEEFIDILSFLSQMKQGFQNFSIFNTKLFTFLQFFYCRLYRCLRFGPNTVVSFKKERIIFTPVIFVIKSLSSNN